VIAHIRAAQNAIELIEYGRESGEIDYAQRIQTFHRFLIEHASQEGNAFPYNPIINNSVNELRPPSSPITQLLGFEGRNLITCLDCNSTREKEMVTHVIDLTYPRKASYQGSARRRLSDTVMVAKC
jgi:PAB-dependent poly(A)-specific ribonuclease subunit 2